jgi:ABC-type branched-subunit amino acid transport system permease subunit
MVIVGGETTVSGVVVGAILVTTVLQVLGNIEDGAHLGPVHLPALLGLPTFGLSAVLVLTVYLRREGLFGRRELESAAARLVRRWSSNRPKQRPQDGVTGGIGAG